MKGGNKVLVVGKGGREHALAWKLSRSPQVGEVFAAPGSAGMSDVAVSLGIAENDHDALARFAAQNGVSLTVVGPEAPLVAGLADRFRREGLAIFGPCAAAAAIEGSKAFAKDLMARHGIPTARSATFSDFAAACRHVEKAETPVVIKADGLAAGKGVVIAATREEAREALHAMMLDGAQGEAGRTVVVEEFLEGEEFSFIALVNGEDVCPLELSRDHKRAFDGDLGPNTGGMGAYSPTPLIDEALAKSAFDGILQKAASALAAEGRPFAGFLYAGLIATAQGPKAIEFNARMGDPEAQALLPRLDGDLFEAISALMAGDRERAMRALAWSADAAVAVTLASKGYPLAPRVGFPIDGLDRLKRDTLVFHGATEMREGRFYATGGRALVVARRAPTIALARREVYEEIARIESEGLFWRSDIGGAAALP